VKTDQISPSTSSAKVRPEQCFETPAKQKKKPPTRNPPLTRGRKFLPQSDDEEIEQQKPEVKAVTPPPIKRSKSEEKQTIMQNQYSDLMYLESVGTLRLIKRAKHRGVRQTQVQSDLEAAGTTSQMVPEFDEKNTKLKISYRVGKHRQDIQFALIVFEQLTRNPATRRNLMSDFKHAVELEDNIDDLIRRNEKTPSKSGITSGPSMSTSKKSGSLYKSVLNSSKKKKREGGSSHDEKTPKKSLRF
jgi:hypothetical protein